MGHCSPRCGKDSNFPLTLLSGGLLNSTPTAACVVVVFCRFYLGIWMLCWTLQTDGDESSSDYQLPPGGNAPDIGLITPRDHMWMNVLARLAVILLVGLGPVQ